MAAKPPRRPTLVDVAQRAGVSRATASLVIRDAPGPSARTRARVRSAAHALGYQPDLAAQSLRRQRSNLIGVMFDAQDPFHADLIESIYAATDASAYVLVLSAVVRTRDERRAFSALTASRCAAAILLGTDEPLLAAFGQELPVVDVGGLPTTPVVDTVHTDDDEGAQLAIDHLAALGHSDIVHIDGGHLPGAEERRTGYRKAMRRHGFRRRERILPGDYTELSGTAAARALLDDDSLPTAIFAGNDRCAVGTLDELRRSGVAVPEQVSVIGYDNSRLARLAHVNLTSVRQDTDQIARQAMTFVSERLDASVDPSSSPDARLPKVARLSPDLVVRGSTGPMR